MLSYPDISPVAFSIGPVDIHWYGLAYLTSFALAWLLGRHRAGRPGAVLTPAQIEDLVFYCAMGVIVGGRLGSALFYNLGQFIADPLWLLRIWEGGMSFHGGLLGVIVSVWIFAVRRQIALLDVTDFVAPLAPIGLFFGRLGNFVGQELWGRETDGWWGMVFPADPERLLRHPSQLYEAVLEGLVLFVILNLYRMRGPNRGALSGLFLVFYSLFRIAVEFVREPDAEIGFQLFGWVTRGQVLSLPMLAVGLLLLVYATFSRSPAPSSKRN